MLRTFLVAMVKCCWWVVDSSQKPSQRALYSCNGNQRRLLSLTMYLAVCHWNNQKFVLDLHAVHLVQVQLLSLHLLDRSKACLTTKSFPNVCRKSSLLHLKSSSIRFSFKLAGLGMDRGVTFSDTVATLGMPHQCWWLANHSGGSLDGLTDALQNVFCVLSGVSVSRFSLKVACICQLFSFASFFAFRNPTWMCYNVC